MKWFLIFLLSCCCITANASTLFVDCNEDAIAYGLLFAQDNDTVIIGEGDCVISNLLETFGVSLDIYGMGTNKTTLRCAPGMGNLFISYKNSTNAFRLHDLHIVPNGQANPGVLTFGWDGYDSEGFYDCYNIWMDGVVGRGIAMGQGRTHNSYGVVHNCFMTASPGYQQMFNPLGAFAASWTNLSPLGTPYVFCMEDNILITDTNDFGNSDPDYAAGNGFFDSYDGAQILYRHNDSWGYSPIGGHGYDSGQWSIRTWEVYSNRLHNWNKLNGAVMVWRGGTGVIFDNEVEGRTQSIFAAIAGYRPNPEGNIYGYDDFDHPTYLVEGVPGQLYTINFSSNYPAAGQGYSYGGYTPQEGYGWNAGFTHFHFTTNLATHPYYGTGLNGGVVLIGATIAETISNMFNAINLGPGLGVTYGNSHGTFELGTDFLAVGLDPTNLYLINALDGTNANGWPNHMAVGAIRAWPLTSTNLLDHRQGEVWPAAAWGNTFNGDPIDAFLPVGSAYVSEGRDFTNLTAAPVGYVALVYPYPARAQEVAINPPAPATQRKLNVRLVNP